jgi:hypothetical protein
VAGIEGLDNTAAMLLVLACTSQEQKPDDSIPVESTEDSGGPIVQIEFSEFQPQNIILINVDTLRADHLWPSNYKRDTLPLLQARSNWVVQGPHYAPSGWTPPSVSSLLTGKEVPGHGVVGVEGLPLQVLNGSTIQQWLGAAGFHTGFFSGNHVIENTTIISDWEQYELSERGVTSSPVFAQRWTGWMACLKGSVFLPCFSQWTRIILTIHQVNF